MNGTNYYYIESDRFVSKIGGGMRDISYGIEDYVYNRDIQNIGDYEAKSYYLFEDGQSMMHRHFDSLGVLSDVILDFDFSIFRKTLDDNKPEHDYMYWYHKDHLGSSTQISDYRERVIHHIEYMPSGEQFSEQRDIWATPYKFNGKELDQETGLYYYGARYYTPEIGIWLSVDPLSDKYPSLSPYAYCALNPVMLVDPDGREIDIWYTDKDKKQKSFSFNGMNAEDAPDNEFVQSVLSAYEYNTKNGGGKRMQQAATNKKIKMNVFQGEMSYAGNESDRNAVVWNPNGGLLTEQGDILSPATILEHEIDHELRKVEVGGYVHNSNLLSYDKNYSNLEEKRVICGSEKLTGNKNGEFNNTTQRTGHRRVTVIVPNPTSTIANKQKSIHYWNNISKNSPHGLNLSYQMKMINKYLK